MSVPSFRSFTGLTFTVVLVALSPLFAEGPARPTTGKVDFNRDIRPILSDNCFACHGPDAKKRKGDLRLDVRDAALESGEVLVAGKAHASELFRRLVTEERGKLMPPVKSGKKLTPAQIALVKRWIDEGAQFSAHWAYVAPKRVALPGVQKKGKVRNGIDRFILARLEAMGLTPASEADRRTLLRRVTLDLTGVPPTPAEMDVFLADPSPLAYEKVVDRLLQSPRFGEHMGRYWLDLVRFGDTHGLHLDNYREMWPYRDWVIRAFNDNKPHDRFIREQLAGDLLPGGKLEDLVATGFNRAHVTTSEGGSITEEVHIRNVNDRVETFGTVFLGLTVACSKCHDHKYDPLTMKDFYSLSAYFNSLEGNPLDGNAARHAPTVQVPLPGQAEALVQVTKKLDAVRKRLSEQAKTLVYDDKLDANQPEKPKRTDHVWIEDALPQGVQIITNGSGKVEAAWVDQPVQHGKRALKVHAEQMGQHVFTGANPGLKVGAGDKLFAHVFLDPTRPPKEIMLQWHTDTWKHRAYWGQNLVDFGKDGSTERRRQGDVPEVGKWVRLEVPIAQVGLKPGMAITGWAFTVHGGTAYWDHAGLTTQVPQTNGNFETLTSWVRVQRATKGAGLPPEIQKLVTIERSKRTKEQQKQLTEYFIQNAWVKGQQTLAPLRKELASLEAERTRLDSGIPVTYVFRETPTPRQAFVLKRGEYDQRGETVGRATPAFLPANASLVKNRLDLADWVLSPNNPLSGRVAVNRFWQQVFGVGIVKTSEDFGVQGEPPSHPELLDWLTVEFRDSGWDVKAFMRLLVTSATYRQKSQVTRETLAKDPANRFLARGPRFRLDAEVLRDQALAVSGLLVERLGGPSVKPPQPDGLWSAVAYVASNTANFVADKGMDKVHRRSVYTFWKRTAPPPQMSTFDAPSRESCTVRRERTNTPLQALLLLNDRQYVECARALAGRTLRTAGGSDRQRLDQIFRVVTCRLPDAKEVAELEGMLADLKKEFARDPKAAAKLIATGESAPDVKQDPVELAAWTMLASTLLNLDEVVNKG